MSGQEPEATTALNLPTGQGKQLPDPEDAYWPASQGLAVGLVEPSGQAYPAGQSPLQAGVVSPVVLPKVPAGHSEQLSVLVSRYCPMAQVEAGAQVVPSASVPSGHRCPVGDVSPLPHTTEALAGEQSPLQAGVVSPVVLPKVPAGHSEHSVALGAL